MKNFINYLFILCITLLVAIVAGGDFAVFLLGFELVLPVFLYLYVWYLRKHIKAAIELPKTVAKGEEVQVTVRLNNTGRLPVSCVAVEIYCRDAFDGSIVTETVAGAIDARGQSCIEIGMTAEYAGRLELALHRIKVYDCFHLLWRRVSFDKTWKPLLVKPSIYQIAIEGKTDSLSLYQRGDAHSVDRSGDDVSEVFGIRGYRAGDTLHRIHWKLSAKTDELLVKEFSNSMKNALYICVDLHTDSEEKWTHERFDGMATILASLCHSLLLQQETHEVFWYNGEDGELHSMSIAGEQDIYEIVGELSAATTYDYSYDFQNVLQEHGMYGKRVKAFLVDMDWNLYSGDQCIASMTEDNMNKELLNLRIVQ